MLVKVISIFKDKNTKKIHSLNEELKVSKERYEEIKEYVDVVKENKSEIENQT